ncbi:MAG: thiamine pyrophosphate-dependent enzyme [Terracidiphilus sp.]|jgi:TPP-dependent pyruvate/acetoin dehydrogenase alpha subunit
MTTRTQEQNAAALAGHDGFSLISNEKLRQLYIAMVKCDELEQRARILSPQSELDGNDGVRLEAAVVGVMIDLVPEDTVSVPDGDFIASFLKGESLDKLLRSLRSSAASPKFAVQLENVIGAAQTCKSQKNGQVAVAFLSDGAASSSLWHKALKRAGAEQLPILFVCLNSSETGEIALQAEADGFPGITVDGCDVVAVYRVATEAIAHARKGNGPTVLECNFERPAVSDPILSMESYLARKSLFSEELKLEAASCFI